MAENVEKSIHSLVQHFESCSNFEKLIDVLVKSPEFQSIQRTVCDTIDIGYFYDLSQDVAKFTRLDVDNKSPTKIDITDKIHITDPIFSSESESDQQCSLSITYEDYQETLDLKEMSHQKSIKDSIYAHFVATRVMGFQVEIDLGVSQHDDNIDLQGIVNSLFGKFSMKKMDLSIILFSVSGKLTLDLKREFDVLDHDNLEYLQFFYQETFYQELKDRFPLRIEIAHLNLDFYFYPLFEKIVALDEIDSSSSQQWIIDCIKIEVVQKVITTAELILSGQEYLEQTQFLQNLFHSFLLNKKTIQNLIQSLDYATVEEIDDLKSFKIVSDESVYKKDFKIKIHVNCLLSLIEHQNVLKEMILNYFNTNGRERMIHKVLLNKFSLSLREDCEKCKSKIKEKDLIRIQWEKCLNRNVKIEYEVFTANSDVNENKVEFKLCRNGVPIDPQLPVLDPPLNIRKIETTDHSITIEWTMPLEDDDPHVRCYRIDYRRVEENSFTKWHSMFTENQKTVFMVDDLQSGSVYVFRVQAQFEEFVGVWSEESEWISTEPFSKLADLVLLEGTHFWINDRSQKCPRDLIDLISIQCSTENDSVLPFSSSHKIFFLKYQNKEFQATQILNDKQYMAEKMRIYDLKRRFDDWSLYVYELEDQSAIYFVQCIPHQRLIDCLENFYQKEMETFIDKLVEIFKTYKEADNFKRAVIRPDNIFIEECPRFNCYQANYDRNIYVNHFIPNCPELQFLMKNKQAVSPFHLHPHLKKKYSHHNSSEMTNDDSCAQFIYSFGWFVWILLEGSGCVSPDVSEEIDTESWLQLLQSGRFPNYPQYLREVMIQCWGVSWNDSQDELRAYWENIEDIIKIQFWMKNQSRKFRQQNVNDFSKLPSENVLIQFSENYKIFALQYPSSAYQATQILNTDKGEYLEEKKRIQYLRNKFDKWSFDAYETEDQSAIFVIETVQKNRLIDCLDEFNLHEIQSFIHQVTVKIDEFAKAAGMSQSRFRPDNVFYVVNYCVSEKEACIHQFIPNYSELQFLIKNKESVHPFHLHPQLKTKLTQKNFANITDAEYWAQFIYSFGWFVWILLEGSGCVSPDMSEEVNIDKWLQSLQSGRFPNYPEYLRDVMIKCWSVSYCDSKDKLRTYWETIQDRMNFHFEINKWFNVQESQCPPTLLNLISNESSNEEKILLRFSETDKIYAQLWARQIWVSIRTGRRRYRDTLTSLNELYQATQIFNTNKLEYQEEKKRIHYIKKRFANWSIYVYENKAQSNLLLFQKMPHNRLIDCLDNFILGQILSFIRQMSDTFEIYRSTDDIKWVRFRPDNVYVDESANIHINHFIPNHSDLPFLMKNKQEVYPFHLHPHLKIKLTQENFIDLSDAEHWAQFIYSFGCFVWILLEGSGNVCPDSNVEANIKNCHQSLQSGKFPDYPEYLRDVMIKCWSVSPNDSLNQLKVLWETLRDLIKSI